MHAASKEFLTLALGAPNSKLGGPGYRGAPAAALECETGRPPGLARVGRLLLPATVRR